MQDRERLIHPLNPNHYRRDPLKISLAMGYIIIIAGYLALFLHAIFAGFSLFFVICNYAMLDKYSFMSYYAAIAPNIAILFVYVSVICCIIIFTYAVFGWILIKEKIGNIILSICAVISIVTLILSFTMIKMSQTFWAMTNRKPGWFSDPNFDVDNSWRSAAFTPYMIKDVARTILFIIQALLYIIGHQISTRKLIKAFDFANGR
ncbi:hypothetical protein TRFO_30421 [Tritrichomonas foetus]|uniref:Uncharacterized protein n=1 Tax=Tritrichomonas foetus TaxID=1144522 RepID=A0A1J4JTM4_9EUKA|nr:hypothetical protein TRFO_30421 [Tritrichomonas foetus]|eukprot:OHT02473.1 hypothetical protein TRFO_30421 [Tritrichomonas foetus]